MVPVPLTKDVIEVALKYLTDRLAVTVAILSAICLLLVFVPGDLGIWMVGHWIWFFLALLFCLCYLPSKYIVEAITETADNRKKCRRLKDLTKKEKEILAPYIRNDYRTRRILFTDPVAKGLERDGILYTTGLRDNNGYEAYNIQEWSRLYLKDHSDEAFAGIPNQPRSGDY